MKKLIIFILLACSGLAKADCPLYTFPENHKLDQEVNNVCQQIQNPVGNILNYSSGTFIYVKASTTNFNGVQYTWPSTQGAIGTTLGNNGSGALSWVGGRVLQVIRANGGTGTSTASTGYVNTNSTINITPLSTSSTIFIFTNGFLAVNNPTNVTSCVTIANGSSGLHPVGNGLATSSDDAFSITTHYGTAVGVWVIDSPGSLSQQTYNTQIKVCAGVGTAYWNSGNQQGLMLAIEVK